MGMVMMMRRVRRHHRRTTVWFMFPLIVLVSVSGLFVVIANRPGIVAPNAVKISSTAQSSVETSSASYLLKRTTKSMLEMESMDELNPYVLLFERVPECGSEILLLILQRLQGWNNFKHVRLKQTRAESLEEREKFVDGVVETTKKHAVPVVLDAPGARFVNFSAFGRQSPTYISMIRDPWEKLLSRYRYETRRRTVTFKSMSDCIVEDHHHRRSECADLFKNKKTRDLSIPHFCGHDPRCGMLNEKWALDVAKANVEKYYEVVGVLEELNATLDVFEAKLPYFFKGSRKMYEEKLSYYGRKHNKIKTDQKENAMVQNYIKNVLIAEYDFYEWNKRRLFKQLETLKRTEAPSSIGSTHPQ